MIDAVEEYVDKADRADHLHTERFQPVIGNGGGSGEGGTVYLRVSDCKAECEPGQSILVGGEEAGRERCSSDAGWASATPVSDGCRTAPSATYAPAPSKTRAAR